MRSGGDVFGRALLDWAKGATTPEVLERDDGFTQVGAGPDVYLSDEKGWPAAERQAIRLLRGRVLDVGCGAGRVALHLQGRGLEVVGLDASMLAASAARLRGVNEVWCLPVEELASATQQFDSLVLFGNNFGIFENPRRAHRLLADLARSAKSGTRLLLESTAPYCGGAPGLDRTHYRRNKDLGVAPGQVRLRFRYDGEVGSWFNWIYVTRREMRSVLRGTGWRLVRVVGTALAEPYVAVVEKS